MGKLRTGFGVFIVFAFILTLIALFTPGWRSYQHSISHSGCFFTLFSPRLRLGIPTAGVCALAFLCLFIAILVYGVRYRSKVAYMTSMSYELVADIYLGYSYWLAVVATIFTLLATIVAGGLIGDYRMPID
ncbi:hypothetical protein NECAME_12201 [Necator americanus]|uniref:Uncharacterized protein n=1 Tax=Necator americanus TaxID=51031 RepID=W2T0Z5_NECAM|nr:hypothetical protein NECAME_12201 [Necator americanus]ETN75675.1 hypothetical protein NECAME_12201 [Necator americanus]